MKAKTLLVLALVGALLVAAAVWLGAARQPGGGEAAAGRERLLPGLEAQLDDIAAVRILGDGKEVVLERSDGSWRMPGRDGWPVDVVKLRTLLLALAQAERVEPKTANPELYPRLGVEEVSADGGSGTLLELSAGDTRHAVIVGNPANGEGTYVRPADQAQSWLVDRNLLVERDATDWLQQELTQIDAQRVERVRIDHAEGPPVDIVARDPGPGFDLANLPKGRSPQSEYVAEATAGFLSALRLADVRRDTEGGDGEGRDGEGGPEWSQAQFALRDGILIDIGFTRIEDAVLARFDARLDEQKAQDWAAAEQAKAAMEYERSQRQAPVAEEDGAGDAAPPDGDTAGAGTDAAGTTPATQDAAAGAPAADGDAGGDSADAPLAVTDPDADRAARLEEVRAEVAALEQRLDGWLFTLPPYKAEHLTKPLADYLAPQE